MKFITLIPFLVLLTFCNSSSKIKKEEKKLTDSIIIEKGIILFSKLRIDYFFPVSQEAIFKKSNYKELQYNQGFVLNNLGPDPRIDLIQNFSDTLIDKRNYPLTNVVPVTIEYYVMENTIESAKDTLCFKLSDIERCLGFDTKLRLIKNITPIR